MVSKLNHNDRRRYIALACGLFAVAVLVSGCPRKRPPVIATMDLNAANTPLPTPTANDLASDRDLQSFSADNGLLAQDHDATMETQGPLEDVLFDFDSADLSETARALLERHAVWLQTHRNTRVIVEGHCDERGTVDYNLVLGERRAQAAREYLHGLGVAAERLTTVSFGKERPLDSGHQETSWARNRRAHFVVQTGHSQP
jgi:peptidoglycan-associated lipoprotein